MVENECKKDEGIKVNSVEVFVSPGTKIDARGIIMRALCGERKEEEKMSESEDVMKICLKVNKFGAPIGYERNTNCDDCATVAKYTVCSTYVCPDCRVFQKWPFIVKNKRLMGLSNVYQLSPTLRIQAVRFSGDEIAVLWEQDGWLCCAGYQDGQLYNLPAECAQILFGRLVYKLLFGTWSDRDILKNRLFKVEFKLRCVEEENKEEKK
ncbi:hypothetical protein [Caldisericum sp.]|uniref:hypothetical protein n=1 Tax=Caldisericum sp. TaxID=2499687 RepID=UPI003D0D052E